MDKIVKLITIVFIIAILYFMNYLFSYMLADYQYEKIHHKIGSDKDKIEKMLFLYSSEKITMDKSLWGRNEILQKGKYCIQYKIFWQDPIDIVYDENNTMIHIYSSYE